MTRAGVFLMAALVAASLGLFAQNRSPSAASPSAASSSAAVAQTSSQTKTRAAQPGTPGNSAPSTPATRDSTANATTAGPNRAIEGSASNGPATSNGQLPQTSTILPLLGLIGLGSLVAGLFARR